MGDRVCLWPNLTSAIVGCACMDALHKACTKSLGTEYLGGYSTPYGARLQSIITIKQSPEILHTLDRVQVDYISSGVP